ncbi:MAG: RNA pyrophosphohydrolase [Rhizobiaceae bacterium]
MNWADGFKAVAGGNGDNRLYRPNVGICLINPFGKIWMGKSESAGPEIVTPGREWQMPQGGIEETEDIVEAARRELWEETGIRSAELLDVTKEWWPYDFPPNYQPVGHKLDPFCGQKQKWVAFNFIGKDADFDITAEHTGEPQEFLEWRWMKIEEARSVTVEFKLEQYERVFKVFRRYLT